MSPDHQDIPKASGEFVHSGHFALDKDAKEIASRMRRPP